MADFQQFCGALAMKYLIGCLGNIGDEYTYTRHNIGFLVADALVKQCESKFELKTHGFLATCKHKSRQLIVLKPNTYMNLSGKAIRYWMQKENISKEQVLIILDDMALPFGKLRLRPNGSDGGHNGLKSIDEMLGDNQYPRLRFGIGTPNHKSGQVDHVLGTWTEEEVKQLPPLIKKTVDAILLFSTLGCERSMNMINK